MKGTHRSTVELFSVSCQSSIELMAVALRLFIHRGLKHIMDSGPGQIERRPSGDRRQGQTIIVFRAPAGIFAKAIGVVALILLLSVAFVFSLLVFAIVAAVALVLLVHLWWLKR